jgi:peptidoglycan/xylan/chitin deacetylase (PgdA/CDA1 family)
MGLLRHWAKAAALRVGPLIVGRFQPRRVILCYHSVHPRHPFRSATPDMFSLHLAWLTEHCDVVSLRTLVAQREAPDHGKPQVAITFDDGHVDNHEYALPLLVRYRIPATFYLTTGYLNRDPAVLARFMALRGVTLSEIEPLSWQQVREFVTAGMEIGAHTFSHPNLAELAPERLPSEIAAPKAEIEDKLGRVVESFAYPFGQPHLHVNRPAIAAAAAAGFLTAVTASGRGVRPDDSLFGLPRFFASTSVEILASRIRGDWDLLGYLQERLPPPGHARSIGG